MSSNPHPLILLFALGAGIPYPWWYNPSPTSASLREAYDDAEEELEEIAEIESEDLVRLLGKMWAEGVKINRPLIVYRFAETD